MQQDSHHKLAPLTLFFHWTIALSMIAAMGFGLYIHELPRTDPNLVQLLYIHKNVGLLILLLALARISWRVQNGLFQPAGQHKNWEVRAAYWTHIILLAATITMPISGIMMVLGTACSLCSVPVFGLFEIGPLAQKNIWVASTGSFIHHTGSKIIIAIILLHALAALKHHYWDKDGTLRRMLGRHLAH